MRTDYCGPKSPAEANEILRAAGIPVGGWPIPSNFFCKCFETHIGCPGLCQEEEQ